MANQMLTYGDFYVQLKSTGFGDCRTAAQYLARRFRFAFSEIQLAQFVNVVQQVRDEIRDKNPSNKISGAEFELRFANWLRESRFSPESLTNNAVPPFCGRSEEETDVQRGGCAREDMLKRKEEEIEKESQEKRRREEKERKDEEKGKKQRESKTVDQEKRRLESEKKEKEKEGRLKERERKREERERREQEEKEKRVQKKEEKRLEIESMKREQQMIRQEKKRKKQELEILKVQKRQEKRRRIQEEQLKKEEKKSRKKEKAEEKVAMMGKVQTRQREEKVKQEVIIEPSVKVPELENCASHTEVLEVVDMKPVDLDAHLALERNSLDDGLKLEADVSKDLEIGVGVVRNDEDISEEVDPISSFFGESVDIILKDAEGMISDIGLQCSEFDLQNGEGESISPRLPKVELIQEIARSDHNQDSSFARRGIELKQRERVFPEAPNVPLSEARLESDAQDAGSVECAANEVGADLGSCLDFKGSEASQVNSRSNILVLQCDTRESSNVEPNCNTRPSSSGSAGIPEADLISPGSDGDGDVVDNDEEDDVDFDEDDEEDDDDSDDDYHLDSEDKNWPQARAVPSFVTRSKIRECDKGLKKIGEGEQSVNFQSSAALGKSLAYSHTTTHPIEEQKDGQSLEDRLSKASPPKRGRQSEQLPNLPNFGMDEDGKLSCPEVGCDARYTRLNLLVGHLQTKHHLFLWECKSCNEKFKQKGCLSYHQDEEHNDNTGVNECQICHSNFTTEKNLVRHKVLKHTSGAFQCGFCIEAFHSEKDQTTHIIDNHADTLTCCQDCHQYFHSESKGLYHFKTLHPDKLLSCDKCKQQFVLQKSLTYHVELKHEEAVDWETAFVCDVVWCQRRFSSREYLNQHAIWHKRMKARIESKASPSDNWVVCDVCGKLLSKGQIRKHGKTHDIEGESESMSPQLQECTICGKKYQHLSRHIQLRHSGRKFKCPHCPKVYTLQFILRQHIMAVHENKRFPCNQCDKSYTFKNDLSGHIAAAHNGHDWPCQFCGKRFMRSSDRNRHEKNVHGRKADREEESGGETIAVDVHGRKADREEESGGETTAVEESRSLGSGARKPEDQSEFDGNDGGIDDDHSNGEKDNEPIDDHSKGESDKELIKDGRSTGEKDNEPIDDLSNSKEDNEPIDDGHSNGEQDEKPIDDGHFPGEEDDEPIDDFSNRPEDNKPTGNDRRREASKTERRGSESDVTSDGGLEKRTTMEADESSQEASPE